VCAALPDVVGFRLGIHYDDLLGHRGLTHSLAFAAVLGAVVIWVVFPRGAPGWSRRALWLYLFIATASHGFLDALTDGGLGVAFFSPFSNARYFFPVHPVLVSPIGIRAFASAEGLSVLFSEIRWMWLPSVLFLLGASASAALKDRRHTAGKRT
jgi:inner membrane protein